MLTSQEDGLEWGNLGKHKVHDEAKDHYKSNLSTIGVQCKSSCDLNLGYNALNSECTTKHVAEDVDLSGHSARANVEDHEANNGLHSSGEDVHSGLLLQQEADKSNNAHDDGCVSKLHENCIEYA